jgi:hypothetical protein
MPGDVVFENGSDPRRHGLFDVCEFIQTDVIVKHSGGFGVKNGNSGLSWHYELLTDRYFLFSDSCIEPKNFVKDSAR